MSASIRVTNAQMCHTLGMWMWCLSVCWFSFWMIFIAPCPSVAVLLTRPYFLPPPLCLFGYTAILRAGTQWGRNKGRSGIEEGWQTNTHENKSNQDVTVTAYTPHSFCHCGKPRGKINSEGKLLTSCGAKWADHKAGCLHGSFFLGLLVNICFPKLSNMHYIQMHLALLQL